MRVRTCCGAVLTLFLLGCCTVGLGQEEPLPPSPPEPTNGPVETSPEPVGFDTGYLIMAPKAMTAGTSETFCIRLLNMTGPVTVTVSLREDSESRDVLASIPPYFMEFPFACLSLEVPAMAEEQKKAVFEVEGRSENDPEQTFTDSKRVWLRGNNFESFIQTDKSIYKPGQTVKFRMLTIDQNFRPDLTPVSKIWVETPSGIRMAQWLDVNTEENGGIVDLEMPMTSDPPLGDWKIKAVHQGKDVTQTFTVDEYVLPKFEIDIQAPAYIMVNETRVEAKICAKYTYGQPVRGSIKAAFSVSSDGWSARPRATIRYQIEDTGRDGCQDIVVEVYRLELNSTDFGLWNARLTAAVEFTETATGVKLSETKDISKISSVALTLEFKAPETFKPGVPFYGKIIVTNPDGTPAGGRTIELTADTNEGRIFDEMLVSPPNGVIDFAAKNISIQSSTLNFYALAPGYSNRPDNYDYSLRIQFMYDPSASFTAQPQYSPSGSFIQVAPILETVDIGSVQTLTIDFTARDAEKENIDFSFLFMSRGNILRSGIDSLQAIDSGSLVRETRQAEEPAEVMPSDALSSIMIDPFISSEDSSDEKPIVIVKPGELNTVQAQVTVTKEMMPLTSILVYYIRKDGEVITDSVMLQVKEVFENDVTVQFEDKQAVPGEMTNLKIQAAPGSLCGIGVVDKSVQLLGGDNQLKKSKVFASLKKHQLSDQDGQVESSKHCPEFVPWWAQFGRRKRSIIYSPYQTYEDASLAFKQMGLVFLTNIQVETRPCRNRDLYYRGRGLAVGVEGPLALPQAVPVFFNSDIAVPDVALETIGVDADGVPDLDEAAEVKVRTYFPETFLWDLVRVGPESSEATLNVEVPDTITEWVGSGFCTSSEYGIGVSGPTTLRAFQPFFASYNLPYSVIRGEEVPISVTVFNYLSECLVVELTLQESNDFVLKDEDRAQRLCICGADSKTAIFNVSFTNLGMIPIEVIAISVEDSTAMCGNDIVSSTGTGFSDGIRRELLVEAEGVEEEYTINSYFCPEETGLFTSVNQLALPVNVVKDSQKAKVTVTGDLMGPTLSNLDKLLRVPTGCGEQNMLGFVPNIFVTQYLESTQQLTPAIEEKAKGNMKIGYQRELNYRRNDNSYSAFGMSDPEGSTWLTAFVVRSYAQARQYIYIDQDDLDLSINFLRERQDNVTGCFQSSGKLCHKAMSGGVNSELTLTAYIVITMLETGLTVEDPAVAGGLRCLADGLPTLSDTYTTTQMAYALTLAESPDLDVVMAKLEESAVEEDGNKFWRSNRPQPRDYSYYGTPAQDIEMTGYALLAYLKQSEGGDALVAGNPIARWIVSQRNSQGGFSSTQDTVIGLQALATYADLAYTGGVSIHLKVRTHPQRVKNSFLINPANRLVMQEMTLDAKNVPTRISFEGRGLGCALLQTAVSYNVIPKPPTVPAFTISHEVREIQTAKRCFQYSMQVCTSYTGEDEVSNMALLRVKMQTGFIPVKGTVSSAALKRQTKAFRKVELDGKMINIYFDELTAEETCIVFSIEKSIDVKDVKDGAVTILDYYEQSLALSEMVKLPCPVEPVYLDPTFGDSSEPFGPLEPLLPLRPRGQFDQPRGPARAGGPLEAVDSAEPEIPKVEIIQDLDITQFNQCPEGKVFADGVKKCISPLGESCEGIKCDKGYTCVDSHCLDLDECSRYPDICKDGSICTNMEGSYLCAVLDCGSGYKMSSDGHCEDLNECDTPDICGVFGVCTNREGGYDCLSIQLECIDGFRLTPDLECEDIDECSEIADICGLGNLCANTPGSYACAIVECGFGFIKDDTGTCVDVDECQEPDACPPGSICANLPGSFDCLTIECDEGFQAVTSEDGEVDCKRLPEVIVDPVPDMRGPCGMPMETGMCRGFFPMFGYNSETGACEEFIYGGCDGNDNRFDTMDACAAACQQAVPRVDVSPVDLRPTARVVESKAYKSDFCLLPLVTGKCRARFRKYGYVQESQSCQEFIFGGCDANQNNFDTLEACEEACVVPVEPVVEVLLPSLLPELCTLPMRAGLCEAIIPMYGYNPETGECEEFTWGGCGGSVNRFETVENCTAMCGSIPRGIPPFVPKKYPDAKYGQCRRYIDDNGPCERECLGDDADCPGNKICCFNGCGYQCTPFTLEQAPEPKEGTCPPVRPEDYVPCINDEVVTECYYDYNCEGELKCCQDGCNSMCVEPMEPAPLKPSQAKAGLCPSVDMKTMEGACTNECSDDYACPDSQKCCSNGCGLRCMPAYHPIVHEYGECPPMTETGTCPEECSVDSDCGQNSICCYTGCGYVCTYAVIIDPLPPRPGQCPTLPEAAIGPCADFCQFDYDCSTGEKCCSNGCGFECMPSPKVEILPPVPPKPGQCPAAMADVPCFVSVNECQDDGDCEGPAKCCSMECDSRLCTLPAPPSPPKPGQCPVVEAEGFGICIQECEDDSSCTDDNKCCTNGCGKACMKPIMDVVPVDPVEPFEPVEPMEPVEPVEPVVPVDPVEPVEPFEPVVPMDPVEPVEPVVPMDPVEPVEPVEPVVPMDPVEPVEPVVPVLPMDPVEPVEPVIPVEPVEPVEPVQPRDPKPGVCPMIDLGTLGICSQDCSDDDSCEGTMKCCTNGCGNTCMPAYDPAVNNFSECPLVTDLGVCVEDCSADSDCPSVDQICCFNGCGHTCISLVQPLPPVGPISLHCPYCLMDLSDLPEDITTLICEANLMMVVKWRAKDNRVRMLRDLIQNVEVSQPSRLLDLEESCPCSTVGADGDDRFIIIGQEESILTGKGKSRSVTLSTNTFAIRNDAKLKKSLDEIRSNCP